MRQTALTPADEPHLFVRALAVDYAAGSREAGHTHVWPQLLYASQGAIRAEAGGRYWTVPPRRGLWIPAGTPHSLLISSRLHLRTLYLRPGTRGLAAAPALIDVTGLLHEIILRICTEGPLDDRDATSRHLGALLIGEMERGQTHQVSLKRPQDPRAVRLAQLFLDPGTVRLRMEHLCQSAGLSRRTAERLFEQECGLPPAQWRRLAALSQGLMSIASGEAIESAAEQAGYDSRSAFAEAFTRAFGFPPGQARREFAR